MRYDGAYGIGHDSKGVHSIGVVQMYQVSYCRAWSYIEESDLVCALHAALEALGSLLLPSAYRMVERCLIGQCR